MRCMRCAHEVTFGWMRVVSSRENPRTGETVTRLLCEPCADAAEAEWVAQLIQEKRDQESQHSVDAGARLTGERGMTL